MERWCDSKTVPPEQLGLTGHFNLVRSLLSSDEASILVESVSANPEFRFRGSLISKFVSCSTLKANVVCIILVTVIPCLAMPEILRPG